MRSTRCQTGGHPGEVARQPGLGGHAASVLGAAPSRAIGTLDRQMVYSAGAEQARLAGRDVLSVPPCLQLSACGWPAGFLARAFTEAGTRRKNYRRVRERQAFAPLEFFVNRLTDEAGPTFLILKNVVNALGNALPESHDHRSYVQWRSAHVTFCN